MAEVQNQLNPLKQTVDQLGRVMRSLYSNGSGGPPGYLEKARDEDKEWKNTMFQSIRALVDRIDHVDDFVLEQKTVRTEREKYDTKRDRRLDTRIALGGVLIALLALLVGWLTYRDSQRKVGDAHQPVVSSSQHLAEHSTAE